MEDKILLNALNEIAKSILEQGKTIRLLAEVVKLLEKEIHGR